VKLRKSQSLGPMPFWISVRSGPVLVCEIFFSPVRSGPGPVPVPVLLVPAGVNPLKNKKDQKSTKSTKKGPFGVVRRGPKTVLKKQDRSWSGPQKDQDRTGPDRALEKVQKGRTKKKGKKKERRQKNSESSSSFYPS
jgi:hypothetical protein